MRKIAFLIPFLLFFTSIFLAQAIIENPEKEIKAELQFRIGSDENEDFYNPADFAVDDEGNIYILDSGNSRIQCFSSEGKFLRSFGRFGQGPGEFSKFAIRLKILEDKNIYLIDNYNRRITVFTKKGEYLTSYKIFALYDDISLRNKTFYLTSIILNENHKPIHFTNDLNKIENSFGYLIEPGPDLFKKVKASPPLKYDFIDSMMTNIIINSNGEIIYSQRNPYHLVKYKNDGQKIKEVPGDVGFDTHFPLQIEFKGKKIVKSVKGPVSSVYGLQLLENDQFIVPIGSPDRSFFYFDLYDSDCNLISRYKLQISVYEKGEKLGFRIYIDSGNNLYCLIISQEEPPWLSKYKLIYK